MEKSPQDIEPENRPEEDLTLSVQESDAEQTEFRSTSSPRSGHLLNHDSKIFPRELLPAQSSEERINEPDAGPDTDSDIYESDQEPEHSGGVLHENLPPQPSGRSSLIGTVAASIGNAVRGATGRASS